METQSMATLKATLSWASPSCNNEPALTSLLAWLSNASSTRTGCHPSIDPDNPPLYMGDTQKLRQRAQVRNRSRMPRRTLTARTSLESKNTRTTSGQSQKPISASWSEVTEWTVAAQRETGDMSACSRDTSSPLA